MFACWRREARSTIEQVIHVLLGSEKAQEKLLPNTVQRLEILANLDTGLDAVVGRHDVVRRFDDPA